MDSEGMPGDNATRADRERWLGLGEKIGANLEKKAEAKKANAKQAELKKFETRQPPAEGPNDAHNHNRELALRYAAAGRRVFPVDATTKQPLVAHWKEDATTDPVKINALWSRHPNAGVGLHMEGLIAIDADRHGQGSPDGIANLQKLVGENEWRAHPIVDTPGDGEHHIFSNPGRLGNSEGGFKGLGINIRGDVRGYIIAPGTVRPDGGRWAPREGCPIL